MATLRSISQVAASQTKFPTALKTASRRGYSLTTGTPFQLHVQGSSVPLTENFDCRKARHLVVADWFKLWGLRMLELQRGRHGRGLTANRRFPVKVKFGPVQFTRPTGSRHLPIDDEFAVYLREQTALRGTNPAARTWRTLDGSRFVEQKLCRCDGKIIAGADVSREAAIPYRDVEVIHVQSLGDDALFDYIGAITRYAGRHGRGDAFIRDNLYEIPDVLYLRGLGDRACRELGRDHPASPGPMQPLWAIRVRARTASLFRRIGIEANPDWRPPAWWVRAGAWAMPHLLLDETQWQAWEFIRYVRQGWRPDLANLSADDLSRYPQILAWLEGREPPPSSAMATRSDLLWLTLHFWAESGIYRPRTVQATRSELKGLL